MKKNKMTTKALSMFLAVIMLFGMVSVGLIVPDAEVTAAAATEGQTIEVNSIDTLNAAIATANSKGTDVITTIKLKGDINFDYSNGTTTGALTTITGNVRLNLNGYFISFKTTKSGTYTSSDTSVQLPSDNKSYSSASHTMTKAMFNVNAGATLHIVNTSNVESTMQVVTDLADDGYRSNDTHHQTSAHIIYSAGTLIIGEADGSNSNIKFYAHSSARNTEAWNAGGYKTKGASVNAYAITVDGEQAVFKMYGGKVQASGTARVRYKNVAHLIVYALNVNNCYSAEIYGGEINIIKQSPYLGSSDTTGLRQSTNTANEKTETSSVSAIRCNTPYLYIFNVKSDVSTYTGTDTSNTTDLYTSCIYVTSSANAPYIYGGNFNCVAERADGNSTAENYCGAIRGKYYKKASAGTINPTATEDFGDLSTPGDGATNTSTHKAYTVFIGGVGNAIDASNNFINDASGNRLVIRPEKQYVDMSSYGTFRDYLAKYTSTTTDVYYGHEIITTNGVTTAAPENPDPASESDLRYLCTGYTHTKWSGKTLPGAQLDLSKITPATAGITDGGSLFLAPAWQENVYTITYTDATKEVSDLTGCDTSYTIRTDKSLAAPTRPGWTFSGWFLKELDIPFTDIARDKWYKGETYTANSAIKYLGRNGNLVFEAVWTPNTYTAIIDHNDSLDGQNDTIVEKTYKPNSALLFPEGIYKPYHEFRGFCVTEIAGNWLKDGTIYEQNSTAPTGMYGADGDSVKVKFEAVYDPIQYRIMFDGMGGTEFGTVTYTYNSTENFPTPTRQGYSFGGWYIENEIEGNTSWKVTENGQPKYYQATDMLGGKYGDVVLKAKWDVSETELYLIVDGIKTGPYSYKYDIGYTITNPEKSTNAPAYRFVKWNLKEVTGEPDDINPANKFEASYSPANGSNEVKFAANKLAETVTYEAEFTPNTFTITYDTNGGATVAPQTYQIVTGNETGAPLATTTKAGYDFAGWTVKAESGHTWKADGTHLSAIPKDVYGNVTLVADWQPHTYTYTLIERDENGNIIKEKTGNYTYETKVELEKWQKSGYVFKTWTVESSDAPESVWAKGQEYTGFEAFQKYGNVVFTATYTPATYNIRFTSAYGTQPLDMTYKTGDTFKVEPSVCYGYEFTNWYVSYIETPDDTNWVVGEKVYAGQDVSGKYGSVVLAAAAELVTYDIIYKNPQGVEIGRGTYDIENTFVVESFSQDGYEFKHWLVESADGKETNWSSIQNAATINPLLTPYYGNVALTAVTTPVDYTIEFNPNGGTPYAGLSYNIESDTSLPSSSREGYDFAGWEVIVGSGAWVEGEVYAAGAELEGMYGSATLKATWTPKTYEITWITGSGTFKTTGYYDAMPDYSTVNTAKAEDVMYTYTFIGWTPSLVKVTGEATYEAQYQKTLKKYTVTWVYETDDVSGAKTETAEYPAGEHPIFNNGVNPVKTSETKYYRFEGWYDEAGNALKSDTVVLGNVKYTARYKEILEPRKVIWKIGDSGQETMWAVGDVPAYVGTPVKAASNGYEYIFSHWEPSIVAVENKTVHPDDYVYEAVFTSKAKTYTAIFDVDGGSIESDIQVEYNRTAGLKMPQPVKAGYTFTGWLVTSNTGTWTQTEALTFNSYSGFWGDVSFKAQYKLVDYKIKVESDDGTTPEYTYTIESTDTLPVIEKTGYTLTGWMVVYAEGNWVAGDTLAADMLLTGKYGNVTLHPVWTAKLYKVNWVSGGITQTVEFRYGDVLVAYPPIAREGYTAVWDKQIPSLMPAEDITFTAQYSPIQYYIRFNLAGGTGAENFYYDITSTEALPVPTREGATFKGWKVSASDGNWQKNKVYTNLTSLEGMYGNVSLTAVWEIQLHKVTWVAGDITRVTLWYHGAVPSFDGIPYKSSDEYKSYVFSHWDKEIVTVTGDVTYTAIFTETEREYIVNWVIDGVIAQTGKYSYNDYPVYSGPTPSRLSTAEFDFEFSHWTPTVSNVTGDISYEAVFTPITKLLGIRIDKSSLFLKAGEEATLKAILSPSTATESDVDWFSSDESVVRVDELGRVIAVATGLAVIRVQSKDGAFRSYCVVNIAPVISEYIVVSANGVSTSGKAGEKVQLYATIQPGNTTDKNIRWSSSNEQIATVDANGLVTFGNVPGEAVITAMSDGYATGTITVTTLKESEGTTEEKKTYVVSFLASTSSYIIAGTTYESVTVIVNEGDTLEFLLTEPHFVTLNGVKYERDTDGVFRIENINQNYMVVAVERADLGIEDNTGDDTVQQKSFFDKLKDFFRSIVDFFRNLFK